MNMQDWASALDVLSTGVDQLTYNLVATSGGRKQQKRAQANILQQMQKSHEYNLASMAEQQRINREQYEFEYAHESPAARVQQLKAAGLNSGLMYGGNSGATGMQGSVGTSSIASAPSGGTNTAPASDMIQASMLALRAKEQQSVIERNRAEARMFDANADSQRGNTRESNARILGIELDNRIKSVNANIQEATENEQIGIAKERYEQLKNENQNLMMDLTVKFSQVERNTAESDLIREQIYAQMVNTAILEIKYQYQQEISKAELDHIRAEIDKCLADIAYVNQLELAEKQKTELQEQLVVAQEQINKIGAVDAKHSTDGFGRLIRRLDQVAGVVGKVFGASSSYIHN